VIARIVERKLLEAEDVILACGAAGLLIVYAIIYAKTFAESETAILFGDAVSLLRRVCPSPLPAEWWVETCAKVDATSMQLAIVVSYLDSISKVVDRSVLESDSWRDPVLTQAIHLCKVSASAGLSARPTMSILVFVNALWILETAAKVQSHIALILDSGVIEALDYACANDFVYGGLSISSAASGVLLALVGRNEAGKTLSHSSVDAVLDTFANYFDPSDLRWVHSTAKVLPSARRVATMVISDVNKNLMLQHGKLLDTLVTALLLDGDNPRRGQDGADALQEACAGVLHELALYGPAAAALRSHGRVMDALRLLCEAGAEESQKRARGALFELDEEARARMYTARSTDAGGGSQKPKHVMISYNWDHQAVILRVVKALQLCGYRMWVDVEQMKGSTVDTMSLAVEDAEVVLIGVSRAYKESTNCRMEAQYAMQREVDTVPLMLVDGYQADGWLGMLMGTRMWYGFYGGTVTDSGLFEGKVEELCRELGERGRSEDSTTSTADKLARAAAGARSVGYGAAARSGDRRRELDALSNKDLRSRAREAGARDGQLDAAADSDEPRAALEALVLELEPEPPADAPPAALRQELRALSNRELRARARRGGASAEQLEAAADSDDPREVLVALGVGMESEGGGSGAPPTWGAQEVRSD
jgi:hypothetical protein